MTDSTDSPIIEIGDLAIDVREVSAAYKPDDPKLLVFSSIPEFYTKEQWITVRFASQTAAEEAYSVLLKAWRKFAAP